MVLLSDGDFTGDVEIDWILATLGGLFNGHAYETEVPKGVTLPESDEILLPYAVVRFAPPYAVAQGRNLGHEQGQPHRMSLTVIVASGNAKWSRQMMRKVNQTLIGAQASNTSAPIEATGGLAYGNAAVNTTPARYTQVQFLRLMLNV